MTRLLRSIELFTGAGGLAIATQAAGFRHEAMFEWNKNACETLRENARGGGLKVGQNWRLLEGDIRDVGFSEFEGIDLVAGGPPCQPFSIAGKHQGYEDSRDMIPQFIRAVREARPRAFLMENVKGLTRPAFRNYLASAILQLSLPEIGRRAGEDWRSHLERLENAHTKGGKGGLRYNVIHRVLNAADYGVPQTRERIFVVGIRADLGVNWHFPGPTHHREVLLHEMWVSGAYWNRHSLKVPKQSANQLVPTTELLDLGMRPWRTVRDGVSDLGEPSLDEASDHRFQPGARSYPGHTGSAIDWPAKTLKAGDHGVPGGENMVLLPDGSVRYFTVREAARLQSFPDRWRFRGPWTEVMRQLGNAVPVQLAQVVAESLAKEIRRHG